MRSLFVLLLGLLGAPVVMAGTETPCESLKAAPVAETRIDMAQARAAAEGMPGFCHVEGQIFERIGFAMRLPSANWNGKFAVAGCGGFCGSLKPDKKGYSNSMNRALRSGYAVIQTDGGHRAESWDTDWAIADDVALRLFAGEWMPHAVATGRGLIEAYYGDSPARSYFSGCSNGGRLGMYAAQRYPEYFDGIAAGGSIMDLTGSSGVHGMWLLQATRDLEGKPVIDQAKLPLLEQHVMKRCDNLDGVTDGAVSRPDLCEPKVSQLQCADDIGDDCFTAVEINAIERLYQGATVKGKQLHPGVPPGSESLWSIWIVGTEERPGWGELAATGNLRLTYGIPSSEPFSAHDYVLADELENLQKYAGVLNAIDPDLTGLESEGAKLFYWHGMADPLLFADRALQYYDEAAELMGEQRLAKTARFMMVPGQGHCWEKPGLVADVFDPLAVVDRWVESGEAPDEVIATNGAGNSASAQSRKLCAHPKRAHYVAGDSDKAESYSCR
jgi:tannase/feruloyl esterase